MTHSLAVALVLMTLLVGCGGSSSETPPPLEPDPELLAGKSKASTVVQAPPPSAPDEAGIIPPLRQAPPSTRATPLAPLKPTWGNASPAGDLAPAPWRTPAPKPARPAPAPSTPAPVLP